MADNDPPSDEEVDVFMELYEEHGTKKAVAERVQWSRPTVSKWIDRRLEEQEEESESTEEPEPEPEPEPDTMEPDTSTHAENGVPEDLIEEPDSPNEILLEIIDRDPKLGDDEATYIKQFFKDYGQLSPQDVASILQDLSFNNKRMTISRVTRHYERAVNTRLRENQDLMYDERWATLLTKVTGDRHYIQQAQADATGAADLGGIQPPANNEAAAGPGDMGGGGINPPRPETSEKRRNGFSPEQRMGNGGPQAEPQKPPQAQPGGQNGGGFGAPQQPQQGQDGLSPFEERLLEMLEDQMEDDDPTPSTPEPSSPSDQIQELVELQQQIEQLQGGEDGQAGELSEKFSSVVEQMNERMARLEQELAQQNQEPQQQAPTAPAGAADDSMLGEIVMLADQIDDPELLSMLIETQTDPEVLEARAKSKEVENETEWKKAVAESLSPEATEKVVDMFSSLTSNLSPPQQQPRQPQQQRQPRQQPPQQQPTQAQQAPENREVSVVEDTQDTAPEATAAPRPSAPDEDVSSPLRDEVEDEINRGQQEAEPEPETPAEGDNPEEQEE